MTLQVLYILPGHHPLLLPADNLVPTIPYVKEVDVFIFPIRPNDVRVENGVIAESQEGVNVLLFAPRLLKQVYVFAPTVETVIGAKLVTKDGTVKPLVFTFSRGAEMGNGDRLKRLYPIRVLLNDNPANLDETKLRLRTPCPRKILRYPIRHRVRKEEAEGGERVGVPDDLGVIINGIIAHYSNPACAELTSLSS